MTFKDLFSGHAATYAQSRPTYPDAMFDWLAAQCRERTLAWDAGCGNGQAARALAARFDQVTATDPSAAQIAMAPPHPRIDYRVEPAESPSLADTRVDLVTVAQAYHWFDHARFNEQVRRALKPGGIVAVWTYGLSLVSPPVDAVYRALYDGTLGPWWSPERRDVENGYRDLPFPFEALAPPAFAMTLDWTLAQYLDYLRSWSASQRHLRETGIDAVDGIADAMASAWGDVDQSRTVSWPLSLRVGRSS